MEQSTSDGDRQATDINGCASDRERSIGAATRDSCSTRGQAADRPSSSRRPRAGRGMQTTSATATGTPPLPQPAGAQRTRPPWSSAAAAGDPRKLIRWQRPLVLARTGCTRSRLSTTPDTHTLDGSSTLAGTYTQSSSGWATSRSRRPSTSMATACRTATPTGSTHSIACSTPGQQGPRLTTIDEAAMLPRPTVRVEPGPAPVESRPATSQLERLLHADPSRAWDSDPR